MVDQLSKNQESFSLSGVVHALNLFSILLNGAILFLFIVLLLTAPIMAAPIIIALLLFFVMISFNIMIAVRRTSGRITNAAVIGLFIVSIATFITQVYALF